MSFRRALDAANIKVYLVSVFTVSKLVHLSTERRVIGILTTS